jgi:hypothetical protein
MKNFIILLLGFYLGIVVNGSAQTVHPILVTPLPDTLSESSGIEVNSLNSIWTHNDSGDLPHIFKIDTLGNLLRILNISDVTATDIEGMAQDDKGNYYLGDFGNNFNNRQDLKIYKIPNPDSISGDSVLPGLIYFNFPDQLSFPPAAADMNFDCEAMFHFKDSLYLFSKNRGISTYCKMYRLPDQPGTYPAQLIDSFNTVRWITAADISPSGKSMVLLSYDQLWLFTKFTDTDFFGGNSLKLAMVTSQKEAIVFYNNTEVYITDERFFGIGGNLYSLDLKQWIVSNEEFPQPSFNFNLHPNPAKDRVLIDINVSMPILVRLEIVDVLGKIVKEESKSLVAGHNEIDLSLPPRLRGMYLVRMTNKEWFPVTKKLQVKN